MLSQQDNIFRSGNRSGQSRDRVTTSIVFMIQKQTFYTFILKGRVLLQLHQQLSGDINSRHLIIRLWIIWFALKIVIEMLNVLIR